MATKNFMILRINSITKAQDARPRRYVDYANVDICGRNDGGQIARYFSFDTSAINVAILLGLPINVELNPGDLFDFSIAANRTTDPIMISGMLSISQTVEDSQYGFPKTSE